MTRRAWSAPRLRRSPAANDRKRPGGRGCSAPVEVTHRRWPDWSRRRRLLRMRGGHPFTATRVLHHMDSAPHPWRSPVAEPVRGELADVCSAPAEVTRTRTFSTWRTVCLLRTCGGHPPPGGSVSSMSSSALHPRRSPVDAVEDPPPGGACSAPPAEVTRPTCRTARRTWGLLGTCGGHPLWPYMQAARVASTPRPRRSSEHVDDPGQVEDVCSALAEVTRRCGSVAT